MKHIFWCIQQLDRVGGTEAVSITIANELVNRYDVTLVVTAKSEKSVFQIDPRIKIYSLGVDPKITKFDESSQYDISHFKFGKYIKLVNSTASAYVYKRNKYRNQLQKLLDDNPDSLMICSSLDNYLYAPKRGKVFFHFHFDGKHYCSLMNKFSLGIARKPDKNIFLTKATLEYVTKRKKSLKKNSVYIYNPVKFEPQLDLNYYNNTIIFVGRFANQKNPILALEVALELKEANFPYHLNMYGSGPLEKEMRDFVMRHNLEDNVTITINHPITKEDYLHSDLQIITSRYEGFVLVKGEANVLSTPTISTMLGEQTYEQFNEGKDGFVIKSNKAKDMAVKIMEVLSDKDKLIELKKSSYEQGKKLVKENIISKWINLIENS